MITVSLSESSFAFVLDTDWLAVLSVKQQKDTMQVASLHNWRIGQLAFILCEWNTLWINFAQIHVAYTACSQSADRMIDTHTSYRAKKV